MARSPKKARKRKRKRLPRPVKLLRTRLGRNVTVLRKARRWTQARLAEHVGNSEKHIGQIERGEVNVGIDIIAMIAHRFVIGAESLFVQAAPQRRQPERVFTTEEDAQFQEATRMLQCVLDARRSKSRRSK